MEEKEISFEEAMAELEGIVSQLENGDVPLEQAIELFQQGMKLSGLCTQKLEHMEKKIEMLIETEQGIVKQPFSLTDTEKEENG